MFKKNDVVRAVSEMPWLAGWCPGAEYVVRRARKDNDGTPQVIVDGVAGWTATEHFELVANDNSPIRTVTRREVVPGRYGVIHVVQGVHGPVLDLWKANPDAEELRSAARIFNEIADVLDEQKEAA